MGMQQFDWRKFKTVQNLHKFLYRIGLGPLIGIIVLLLTTTGRKSGLPRVTPLQYEVIGGNYCLGAARGKKADWVRNIEADPRVTVRVKNRRFNGTARVSTDVNEIADFLETRLHHHPLMMGMIMQKAHHLPRRPSRAQLEALAADDVMVVITPDQDGK